MSDRSNQPPAVERRPNRLIGEASPYLLQHAHNPVDWYPWGAEALQMARAEDKPILLSIGYAACHWCHVMEHESFEDLETAAKMNERFVCIKVDREERPDLDAIYMDSVQEMTGQGGWPMTVFLTPEGRPFYAGTYFPKEDRHGLPAFGRVLDGVAEAWRDQREAIEEQGRTVVQRIARTSALRESPDALSEDVLVPAHSALRRSFDPRWGGFGSAPKFPQPMTLDFVLRCHLRGYPGSDEMLETTLDRMAAGGVYDQVGGGFHRYSVDQRWHVPHFEKMLYDNAQLARLYARAWQVTHRDRYRRVARETLDYLLREMRHPEGGFFSSQDADSEGEEGKFYAWSWDELQAIVGDETARWLGAITAGNWEGQNVLWVPGAPADDHPDGWPAGRQRLFEAREERVPPGTDDKVLAAWNGLAISAFAECGRIFGEQPYVDAAVKAADFVLTKMRRDDGRLLRAWREGRTGAPGYLDDYALMGEACLTLYETTFELRFFREAKGLADDMLRLFRDEAGGGFFQTGSDAEALVLRPKELFDNAVPSGSSAAANLLQRLALLTGDVEYERAGVSALRLVRELMARSPTGFGHALCALDLHVGKSREVAIVGDPNGEDTRRLVAEVHGRFLPNAVLAVASADDAIARGAVGLLKDRSAVDGKATAYVCERFVCGLPVTEPQALAAQLSA
jgi:uncharacterized protein YyaL (SSP411 family)